jgi:hypothetical protein
VDNTNLPEDPDCLLRLTPDECQDLSNFLERFKNEAHRQREFEFYERIQTTLQDFF